MAETIIGPTIQIEGDISGSDALAVHGLVRGGRIQVKDGVVIHASGRVEGDVESAAVEIAGVVQGNVAATDKVEIKAGGKLFGDVKAPRILIADGASFKGNINMGG
ncbi:MAG: polymer-forming cytoskeletal protein [Deltaproteobacteria bacterium]|jgi:cytoskeletal protein CcmA (bactofilin family)|nr:polymer-forming cytoskeletal protein [Deltaproteobacteria bacterium]